MPVYANLLQTLEPIDSYQFSGGGDFPEVPSNVVVIRVIMLSDQLSTLL
jgi:hypothetical protein